MISQLIKFLVSGGLTVGVEYGSFLALLYVYTWPLVPAHIVSFCMGMVTSFLLNRLWTFRHKTNAYHQKADRQFWMYGGLGLLNLGLSTAIVQLLVSIHMPATAAKFSTMAAIAAWNFVIYQKIIFKRNAPTV